MLGHPGSHACLLYETPAEQKNVVLPFIHDGLRRGEHCVYVTSEETVDDWKLEFQAHGIDVMAEEECGALLLLTFEQWNRPGEFNSVVKSRELWHVIEDRLVTFSGVRFAVEMGWTLEQDLSADLLCHWEATSNLVLEDTDVRAICQYDLNRHPAEAIHSALRTHAVAIFEGRGRSNPYYDAPLILENEPHLNKSMADARVIEEMLARLRSAT